MLLNALILIILLLHTFRLRFYHGITSESLLLFQFSLYLYRHSVITSLYLLFIFRYNLDTIIKVINSSPLPFTNQKCLYQRLYSLWRQSLRNQYHQWTSPLHWYASSWIILSELMYCYNGLTYPGYLFLDDICTTYNHTLDLDQILDLSPSFYWHINWIKFDATCSQILSIFADDEPLSGFYYLLDDDLYPLQSYPGK